MHFEMQAIKFLIVVFFIVLWCQNAQFKEVSSEVKGFEVSSDNSIGSKVLLTEIDKRNIKDLWYNIKNSIINAWDALKDFAENTKQKIKNMNQKVKARGEKVVKSFEIEMNRLKKNINDILKDVVDETEVVKKCLIEERQAIENIIKDILQHLSVCITRSHKNISFLNGDSIRTYNDTDFFKDLENKFENCQQDVDNVEECLNQVRKDAFNDMEKMEIVIRNNRMESRNMADDIAEKIITCSIDAVIETSSSITLEVIKIARCIIDGKSQLTMQLSNI